MDHHCCFTLLWIFVWTIWLSCIGSILLLVPVSSAFKFHSTFASALFGAVAWVCSYGYAPNCAISAAVGCFFVILDGFFGTLHYGEVNQGLPHRDAAEYHTYYHNGTLTHPFLHSHSVLANNTYAVHLEYGHQISFYKPSKEGYIGLRARLGQNRMVKKRAGGTEYVNDILIEYQEEQSSASVSAVHNHDREWTQIAGYNLVYNMGYHPASVYEWSMTLDDGSPIAKGQAYPSND